MATGKVTMPLAYYPGVDCVNGLKGQVPDDFNFKTVSGTQSALGISMTVSMKMGGNANYGIPEGMYAMCFPLTTNTAASGFTVTSQCLTSTNAQDEPIVYVYQQSSTMVRVSIGLRRLKSWYQIYRTTIKLNSTGATYVFDCSAMYMPWYRQNADTTTGKFYRAMYLAAYWATQYFS